MIGALKATSSVAWTLAIFPTVSPSVFIYLHVPAQPQIVMGNQAIQMISCVI